MSAASSQGQTKTVRVVAFAALPKRHHPSLTTVDRYEPFAIFHQGDAVSAASFRKTKAILSERREETRPQGGGILFGHRLKPRGRRAMGARIRLARPPPQRSRRMLAKQEGKEPSPPHFGRLLIANFGRFCFAPIEAERTSGIYVTLRTEQRKECRLLFRHGDRLAVSPNFKNEVRARRARRIWRIDGIDREPVCRRNEAGVVIVGDAVQLIERRQ